MEDKFDDILDRCIDRINRGDRIEDCLADYPGYADELRPLLESMLSTLDACSFVPQDSARQGAWRRFTAALGKSEQRREKSRFSWIPGRARAWAAVATVVVVALVGYFGIMQLTSQTTSPGIIPAEADPEGNFAFLISDAQNAIGDFQSLDLTVSSIRLHRKDGGWVEFAPETNQVDLTLLQGDLAQQVWKGNVPEGQYSAAVLYIAGTSGVLKNTDETVYIELRSGKLRLDIDFEVSADLETEFVYDVTVIAAGSSGYMLQPVAGESGTDKSIKKVDVQGQGESQGQGQGQAQGQGQGGG